MEGLKKDPLEVSSAALVEVTVPAEAPLFFFAVQYTASGAVGEFKIALLDSPRISLVCRQDEPGYRASFRGAVVSLANSLRDPTLEYADYRFHQIEIVKAGGAPVGVYETTVVEGDGGLEERRVRSLIVNSSAKTVRTKQVLTRQFQRGGVVEDGGYSVGIDGVWNELQLRRGADGRYAIKGTQAGKPIEASFAAPDGLATEATLQRISRDLLAKKIEQRKLQQYDGEEPRAPVELILQRDPARTGALLLRGAGVEVSIEVDPAGRVQKSAASVKGAPLTTETLLLRGSL